MQDVKADTLTASLVSLVSVSAQVPPVPSRRNVTLIPLIMNTIHLGVTQFVLIIFLMKSIKILGNVHNLLFFVIQYEKLSLPYLIVAPLAAERHVDGREETARGASSGEDSRAGLLSLTGDRSRVSAG